MNSSEINIHTRFVMTDLVSILPLEIARMTRGMYIEMVTNKTDMICASSREE